MPAIFSFSLDYRRDRDIIERLERHKNRSSFIRHMLREELNNERNEIMIRMLYDAYVEQMQMRYTMPLTELRKPRTLYWFKEKSTLEIHTEASEEE